jgi:hypothetical protein
LSYTCLLSAKQRAQPGFLCCAQLCLGTSWMTENPQICSKENQNVEGLQGSGYLLAYLPSI